MAAIFIGSVKNAAVSLRIATQGFDEIYRWLRVCLHEYVCVIRSY